MRKHQFLFDADVDDVPVYCLIGWDMLLKPKRPAKLKTRKRR